MATQIQTTAGEVLRACDEAGKRLREIEREARLSEEEAEKCRQAWKRSSWWNRTFFDVYEPFVFYLSPGYREKICRVERIRRAVERVIPTRVVLLDVEDAVLLGFCDGGDNA